ncbi:uncharacterized protein [Parasteatoda tepidariorum]|uniref:uncharacterized protein n=1 Tax=Parasteatoda tepidariorum TaxID=114398 RepID=UPI001C729632|nr:uncharacterized protein LOC107451937 [Parasteatoda tepidariorum]XP_015923675.2 uncharacterized protein LOC107451937 [Parasteatoda tepidariorum]
MKIILIVGVILCMILKIKAQKSNELAPETSHDPSEYQKGAVDNKTHSQSLLEYQKRAVNNETEFLKDIHQHTEYQRGTVTNITESHDFFSIIRFLPNLIPNIVKTRHWISPYSFGYGLEDKVSDKVEHGYSDLAISTNKISNELATETSPDSSEYQNGTELSTKTFHEEGRVQKKGHPLFFIFRFLLHSFINLLSPHRWISSGSIDMENNRSDEATTHQDVFKTQDRKVANEVNPPHVEKSQRSDQTGVHLRKFHVWYLSNPRLPSSQPATGWLSGNETTHTTLAGSYGFLIKIKKRSNKHFRQFSHVKWIFWKSIFCFIFKVTVHCLVIMGLLLLFHNLFSMKKNTEHKRRKSNKVGYYLVV